MQFLYKDFDDIILSFLIMVKYICMYDLFWQYMKFICLLWHFNSNWGLLFTALKLTKLFWHSMVYVFTFRPEEFIN